MYPGGTEVWGNLAADEDSNDEAEQCPRDNSDVRADRRSTSATTRGYP